MKKGWNRQRLGDVLDVQNGYAFDSERFNPTKGLPLIRIRSLKPGVETETRYDGEYDEKYIVRAGDLLIGMDGEFGCYEWKGEPSLLNQRVCRLQGFSGELLPRFLFYGVNDYLKAIEDVTGYATVKHLSSKQILAIEFPVPPLAEQQRIVGVLDEAFAGLATAQAHAAQNLQNARALFASHLQSVFALGAAEMKKGWTTKPLVEFCEFQRGLTYAKGDEVKSSSNVVLRANNVDLATNRLDFSELKYISDKVAVPASKLVRPGSLLICTASGSKSHLGKVAFIDDDYGYAFGGFMGQLTPGQALVPKFLFHMMTSEAYKEFIAALSDGANINNLKFDDLGKFHVPVPPLAEQQRIVKELDALAAETQRLTRLYEQKQAALAALKKSLLHQAFTGEL